MLRAPKSTVLVADAAPFTRRMVAEVLRGAGFQNIINCRDGRELIERTEEYAPRVVITTSRLPEISGLEFTRAIRAGFRSVPRNLSIIAMTDTPTRAFLHAARDSGVDEMLVRPFTADAIIARIEAVVTRPRPFVDSVGYAGPCRRRRTLPDFSGPMRRLDDPVDEQTLRMPWETDEHRKAVRSKAQAIGAVAANLNTADRRQLRQISDGAKDIEQTACEAKDDILADAARSLGRYIVGMGASSGLDKSILQTHIDAMITLSFLAGEQQAKRRSLADGLKIVVDKRLSRSRQVMAEMVNSRI